MAPSNPINTRLVNTQPEREVRNPQDELEDDDALSEVMMAIDMRNRDTVGCAYYVAREETLYMLNDVKFGSLDIVDMCWSKYNMVK